MTEQPRPTEEVLNLGSGDGENGWITIENFRLRIDGKYLRWIPRGGTELVQNYGNTILRLYPITTVIATEYKNLIGLHLSDGSFWIYDTATDDSTRLVDGQLSNSEPSYVVNVGIFLYIFDSDRLRYRVVNLETNEVFPWMNTSSSAVIGYRWIDFQDKDADEVDELPDTNVWGFKPDRGISALTFNVDDGTEKTDAVLSTYADTNTDLSRRVVSKGTGTDDFVSVAHPSIPATPDLLRHFEGFAGKNQIDTSADDYDPVIARAYVVVDMNYDGSVAIPGRPVIVQTKVSEIYEEMSGDSPDRIKKRGIELWLQPEPDEGVSRRFVYATRWQSIDNVMVPTDEFYSNSQFFFVGEVGVFGTVEEDTGSEEGVTASQGVVDITSDDAGFDSNIDPRTADFLIERDDKTIATEFEWPVNGSKNEIAGNIRTALSNNTEVTDDYNIGVPSASEISLIPKDVGSKYNGELSITPTQPSTLYFDYVVVEHIGESVPGQDPIEGGDTEVLKVQDFTPDSSLLEPISTFVPMVAGIPVLFHPGSLEPSVVSNLGGIAFLADYRLNRPIPTIHTAEKAPKGGNVYISSEGSGYGERWLSVVFFYTDGSRSRILSYELPGIGHVIQLHSLNRLVAYVDVIYNEGADYGYGEDHFLVKRVNPTDPEFIGKPLLIPDQGETDELEEYDYQKMTDNFPLEEHVNIRDHVLSTVPVQEPRIDGQIKIADSSRILGVIPMDFDEDKTLLRYRLNVLTNTNIQMGFITTGESDGKTIVTGEFDVIDPAVSCVNRTISRFGQATYFRSNQGLSVISGRDVYLLLDSRRYPEIENWKLLNMAHNERHNEIMFIFSNPENTCVVYNMKSQTTWKISYNVEQILRDLIYFDENLFGAFGTRLAITDDPNLNKDIVSVEKNITCVAESDHLGDSMSQVEILEVRVSGNKGDCTLSVDLQDSRREANNVDYSDDFSKDYESVKKSVFINGTSYFVNERAVMPRMRIEFESTDETEVGYIEHVAWKLVPLENKGLAR